MYRISYGNGQVSSNFKSYIEAARELIASRNEDYSGYYRIQHYIGDGEWEGLGKRGRLANDKREGL